MVLMQRYGLNSSVLIALTAHLKRTKLKGLVLFLFVISIGFITGCTNPFANGARDHASQLASNAGWYSKTYATTTFDLYSFQPSTLNLGQLLTIVIEGDGRAWFKRNQPSPDPTPIDPIGLKLALALNQNTIYLARPCQYVSNAERRNCSPVFWTNARYSPEVIEAFNSAIEQIKQETRAASFRLVGFSGGGTLAALLAIARDDIAQLITVAAPLDIDAWTSYHNVTKLRYSQNPAKHVEALARIPQVYIVGDKDEIVPAHLATDFLMRMPNGHKAKVVIIPGADHRCCWKAAHIREQF